MAEQTLLFTDDGFLFEDHFLSYDMSKPILELARKEAQLRLNHLVFRRVKTVDVGPRVEADAFFGNDAFPCDGETGDQDVNFLEDKNLEYHHAWFSFETFPNQIRDNDDWQGISLSGDCTTFAPLDFTTLYLQEKGFTCIAPREGDLICGYVDEQGRYYAWQIASEQLYRMWSYLMYDTHASFSKKTIKPKKTENVTLVEKGTKTRVELTEDAVKKHMLSGNTLCTSAWKKYDRIREKGIDTVPEVSYVHSRAEIETSLYVTLYPAIVLLLRYGEYPSGEIRPTFAGVPVEWDFDKRTLDQLVASLTCESRIKRKEVQVKEVGKKKKWTKIQL